jgi:glutathionylspermidine synthase
MNRAVLTPRADWPAKAEALGFTYHTHETGPYWDESACYVFSAREIDELEAAANTLHQLCLDAAQVVIDRDWWARLGIPDKAVPTILDSWNRDDPSLYGRFDLAYDGVTPPKLLEYNADTPTALIEAAVVQWYWLQERFPARISSIRSTRNSSRRGATSPPSACTSRRSAICPKIRRRSPT